MVKSSRKAASPGPIRPLNLPAPIDVAKDEQGRPIALTLRGRRLEIASIEDIWEISDEWWRPAPIARRYYAVTTQDGGRVTLFRDLVSGGWYQQRGACNPLTLSLSKGENTK